MILLFLFIAGVIYQKIGTRIDNKQYKPIGKVLEVSGHKMHIFTKGEGNVTVVFVSGCGTPSPYVDYYPLYSDISKHSRIAVYERPGYGWSEISDISRDIDTIAKELHELLEKAGVPPPYIMVAHSLGSLEVLRYTQLYKDEVKGIVMVDAGSPEYYVNYKPPFYQIPLRILQKLSIGSGFSRLIYKNTGMYKYSIRSTFRNNLKLLPKELKDIDIAMCLMNTNNRNVIEEEENIVNNSKIVLSGRRLGNIPLIVFSSDHSNKWDKGWKEGQEKFREWSSESELILAFDSKHYIHNYKPEIINNAIFELLNRENK